jgi:hypothetical protein
MNKNFRKPNYEINSIEQRNKLIKKIIENINNIITNSIYVKLVNVDSVSMFYYLLIIIITLYFANFYNIKFKSVIGIILGLTIVYIYYKKNELDVISYNDQLKIKLELIEPRPKNFDSFPELINFFYSIRLFNNYNPEAFSDCIKYIDNILTLYSDISIGIQQCDRNYDIVKDYKFAALNSLHSVIYMLKDNPILENKLKEALIELHKLLNIYEEKIINICNEDINKNGYNIHRKYIYNNMPKAYNLNNLYYNIY